MKTIFIVCALLGVKSTSTTYTLTETPHGLVGRVYVSGTSFASFIIDTQNLLMESMYTIIDSNEFVRPIRIGRESEFASRNNSTMILPPSDSFPFSRMITNPIDPASHCFERTIGIADMYRGTHVGFYAGVELLWSGNDTDSSTTMPTGAVGPYPYELSTVGNVDIIPARVYDTLLAEITRLDVQTAEDENVINQLPTIEYTIYRSMGSEDVVAKIQSEPRDYLQFTSAGIRLYVQPDFSGIRLQLGLNTLKHIGVLLDYQHDQIGFCEPL
jgi:hypothetical protein